MSRDVQKKAKRRLIGTPTKIVAGLAVLAGIAIGSLGLGLFGGMGMGIGTGIVPGGKEEKKADPALEKGAILLKDSKIFLDGKEITLDQAKAHIKKNRTANMVVHGSALAVHVSNLKSFCDEEKIQYSSTVVSDK